MFEGGIASQGAGRFGGLGALDVGCGSIGWFTVGHRRAVLLDNDELRARLSPLDVIRLSIGNTQQEEQNHDRRGPRLDSSSDVDNYLAGS